MSHIESNPPIGVLGTLNGTEEALVLQNGVLKRDSSVVRKSTDANGNMVLVGADGVPIDTELFGFHNSASLGIPLLDFSTLIGYSIAAGGTMELVAASVPEIGKTGNSIKVTVPAGTTKAFDLEEWTALNIANSHVMLVVENQTLGINATGVFYLGVQSALTDHYYSNISFNKYGLDMFALANNGTANRWTVGGGAPTFATLTDGRVNITANAANDAVIVFHGIYAAPRCPPIIQIIQDDGPIGGYTELYPLLNKYGFKAGFSIIADLVGSTASYMSEAQLGQLYAEGHDMIPHGQYSLDTYGSAALAIADIQHNADYLTALGYTRGSKLYVYPNGTAYYSASDRTTIKDYLDTAGYLNAYIASGRQHMQAGGVRRLEVERYAVNAAVNTTTLLNELDLAIDSGQGMVLMIHNVVASGAAGDASNRADVETILAGIQTRVRAGKCVVLPPSKASVAHRLAWAGYSY